jgi:ABC-type spermidine/putrescine transport system permease subunit II
LKITVLLIALFLVFPALFLIPLSLSDGTTFQFPPPGWSLRWYENLVTDPAWLDAIVVSLKVAAAATILAVVIGTCATFALFRFSPRARALGTTALISPLVIPNILIALAMYTTFLRLGWAGTLIGLILANTCLTIPYVIIAVSARLHGYQRSLTSAAQSLGATPFATFRQVTFPLILPGVVAGALFAFVVAFDELVIALLLQGRDTKTLSVKMFSSVIEVTDPTIAAASSVLVVVVSVVVLAVQLGWINGSRRRRESKGAS